MNASHEGSSIASAAGDDDGHLDPADAATLLASTRRSARRDFSHHTPLFCAFSAVVLLVAYGLLWLSVRGQHPYVGPSLAVIGWVYGVVGVSVAVSLTAYRRASGGVHGRSRREDGIAGLAVGVPWVAVYVFNGALHADGFGSAIVYGVFDAAGPWLVVGTGLAALAAGREQWDRMAAGLAVVVIGTTAAFGGPIGCWGVLAVAGFIGLLALGATQYVRLRRA